MEQTLYTLTACERLMDRYYDAGGECVTLEEGSLGLGLTLCYGPGLKTAVIREKYINCWQSGHTVRMYNKMPEKYRQLLEKAV